MQKWWLPGRREWWLEQAGDVRHQAALLRAGASAQASRTRCAAGDTWGGSCWGVRQGAVA